MKSNRIAICTAAMMVSLLAGCTHYYKVTDPSGGMKEYYTTDIDSQKGGAIKIKDARTGARITLQSSEVKEISEEEFNAALKAPKGTQGTQETQPKQ